MKITPITTTQPTFKGHSPINGAFLRSKKVKDIYDGDFFPIYPLGYSKPISEPFPDGILYA